VHCEAEVLDLIGLIYNAAGDAVRWPAFLKHLGNTLQTTTNNLFCQAMPCRHGSAAVPIQSVGMDPAFLRSYLHYYRTVNFHLIRGGHLLREGRVYRSEALCPEAEEVRTEFYNDWIKPQGMGRALFGVISLRGNLASMINVVRPFGAKSFSEDDVRMVSALLPHLRMALQLHQRITRLESLQQAATDALNRWPLGVILLNTQGQAVLMNRSASDILRQNDGLSLDASGLVTAQPNKTAVLRSLIQCAIQTSLGLDSNPGWALTLPRPSLKRALNVFVTPVCSNKRMFPEPGAAAVVFVSDPDGAEQSSEDVLGQLYGLSRAEAGVGALLIQGKDLKEVSAELQVSRETARTHLKRIFEKTGTRRQTELVHLVLRGPAVILMKNHPNG
jgi:DNA-binding CsgD family transcriptional regulator/PAS domain-containing protein